MRRAIHPLFWVCLLLATMSSRLLAVQTTKEVDSYGRDYYVFTLDKIDPARTYWLVLEVGVFEGPTVGTRADEDSGARNWVERGDCIGISVSFPQGYQVLAQDTGRQLLDIFRKLQGDFELHPQIISLWSLGRCAKPCSKMPVGMSSKSYPRQSAPKIRRL